MPATPGLKQRINRALLLQAGAIAVAAVVGVYLASIVLKNVLITQALRQEADYFWARRAEDPGFALPDTRNLTGYITGEGESARPDDALVTFTPGFHTLPRRLDFGTVYVTERDGKRLYLVFDGAQVGALAAWFGLVPLTIVLLVLYLSVWLIYRASQRAVSPIARLARIVDSLDPGASDARAFTPPPSLSEADAEVRVLYQALSGFSERLNAFVERERNFTRDASHELRSPLTVIRLAADMLLAQDDLSATARDAAVKIRRSALEMSELVEAFLLLARESDGNLATHEVCVNELVEEELARAGPLAADKPIEVEVTAACRLYTTASDKVLSVLLGNLIRNAFLYTEAGRVHVHVRANEVQIEDSGVGMDSRQIASAFEPFQRANPTGPGGYGVGLTIVKRLSDRFEWPVQIASQPGAGTRVTVRFPLARCE